MTEPCSRADFIRLYNELGPTALAAKLNVTERAVYRRRDRIEKSGKFRFGGPRPPTTPRPTNTYPHRAEISVKNGLVIVGSDAHLWPGPKSTAMRAFIAIIKSLRPKAVVLNGDVLDFASISRHAPIGWENRPSPQEEIEAAQAVLNEIELAAGRGVEKIWTLGNHDARFETRLATVAPEYAKVAGVHLRDHFPQWRPCWSVFVNNTTVIKHRFKGGVHAPFNNTMWAGRSMITGHLHSQHIRPFTDYNGTRYGVDTGCLADPDHRAFIDYTEDAPKNWRSGFALLTYQDGVLLPPELVTVWSPDSVVFRGSIIPT